MMLITTSQELCLPETEEPGKETRAPLQNIVTTHPFELVPSTFYTWINVKEGISIS